MLASPVLKSDEGEMLLPKCPVEQQSAMSLAWRWNAPTKKLHVEKVGIFLVGPLGQPLVSPASCYCQVSCFSSAMLLYALLRGTDFANVFVRPFQ